MVTHELHSHSLPIAETVHFPRLFSRDHPHPTNLHRGAIRKHTRGTLISRSPFLPSPALQHATQGLVSPDGSEQAKPSARRDSLPRYGSRRLLNAANVPGRRQEVRPEAKRSGCRVAVRVGPSRPSRPPLSIGPRRSPTGHSAGQAILYSALGQAGGGSNRTRLERPAGGH